MQTKKTFTFLDQTAGSPTVLMDRSGNVLTPGAIVDSTGNFAFDPASLPKAYTYDADKNILTITYGPNREGRKVRITNTWSGGLKMAESAPVLITTEAVSITLVGPAGGAPGVPSGDFTVSVHPAGAAFTPFTYKPSSPDGKFTPESVDLSFSAPSATFKFTPYNEGLLRISGSTDATLTLPQALTFDCLTPRLTVPKQPAKPVLTALVGAISVAYVLPADGGSAILEGQFTDINGVSTKLTGSPQTIAAAPGEAITGAVRFRNALGWGDYSPQAAAVIPSAPKRLLFTSTNNRPLNLLSSPVNGNTEFHFCTPYFVGSGDLEQLVLSCSNTVSSGVLTTLGDWTIEKMAVQNADFTASYPVTFNGQRSKVLAPGEHDIHADPLLPTAALPLTRGSKYWVKGKCIRVDGKQTSGADGRASNATGQLTGSVNPANSTVSDIDALGKQTVTSGAAFTAAGSSNWCPIALGTYKSAVEPLVPFGIGDSNMFGFGDGETSREHGFGCMQRALAGDGTAAQVLSGGNFSITGRTIQALTTEYLTSFAQYANLLVEQPGGNSFLGAATGAQVIAYTEALIAMLRTYNPTARMLRMDIGPHTTGAWALADQSDQTVVTPQYITGGPVEVWRAALRAKVGKQNGYHAYIDFNLWRSGPDPLKWPGNGTANYYTTDGTHGTAVIEADKAVTLRAAMIAAFSQ